MFLTATNIYSQVGIGNEAPRGLLDVNDNPDGNATAGLVLPHAADVTALQNPADNDATSTIVGTIAFNSTMDCIQFIKNDGTWSECISITQLAAVGSLDCSGATNNGTLTSETVAAGNDVNSVISYTGGNGGAYSEQTVGSEGVDGLMATLTAGNLENGDGLLTYTITGTPLTAGTATFAINIGGQTCDLTRTVNAPPPANLPGNITLTAGQRAFIASVFDNNYLPYTVPATTATTGTEDPDGTMETSLVNIQGMLTTTGIRVKIPYTVTGSGNVNLPAFSQRRTVPSNLIQGSNANSTDGGGGDTEIEFSYPVQTNLTGSGTIEATIKTVSGTLNAVKLDINRGIGTDLGVLMAQFTIAINSSGGTGSIDLRNIPGIPDRNFADANHQFLYLPIVAEDGKVWLNNNLGANYANINHDQFNLSKQAETDNDHHAYGSKFQWGRYSDGHELMSYTNSTTGSIVNGTTSSNSSSDMPGHNRLIIETVSPFDWRSPQNNSLWQGAEGINNPCPQGYRVPTILEWIALNSSQGTPVIGPNKILKLSQAGWIQVGVFMSLSTIGVYWSSTVSTQTVTFSSVQYYFFTGNGLTVGNKREFAFPIRCIRN